VVHVKGSGSSDLIWVWALAMSGCLCVGASLSLSHSLPSLLGDRGLAKCDIKLGVSEKMP
jgi:hypothetical protein